MIQKLIIIFTLLLPLKIFAQTCPDDYACAKFYINSAWPRDGLIEHWVLDPSVQGDRTNGAGDFENWTGTEGGCTDCPASWICDCTTYGGDVDDETTHIYKNNTSMAFDPSGAYSCITTYLMTFTQFETYQINFCYQGSAGTEDLIFGVGNLAMTDTYDFDTDAFTGALTMETFLNIGTTWTCVNYYLYVGPTTKSNYYVALAAATADGTAIYIDDVSINRLYGRNVVGSCGNVLSVPTTSDQQWGHSEVLLPRTGTGPAYKTGMRLDGVNDYISCADATCEMDPRNWTNRGFFSVGCRAMADTVAAGTSYIMSKYAGGGQASWGVSRSAADLVFIISDDGVNTDTNLVSMFNANTLHGFVSTFDPTGGSGACENNLYYNAYQVDTDAAMTECVPFDSNAEFVIGGRAAGNYWQGSILECSLWEKELTAIEANKYISPYFPGSDYNDGFYVDTCSQAASHATCSTQTCRDGTPDACQAEGTGVMACFGSYTELKDNNSFESYAGDPSVANFNDWTESGNITAYLADAKHGDVSVRMKGGSLTSDCLVGGIGSDLWVEIAAKNLVTEGGVLEVWLREYDTGFCTNQLAINTLFSCTPGSVYDDCGALFDSWNVATSSYTIQIVDTTDGDILIDNVSVKEASFHTPWVHSPTGAGSTTYNARQYELHNPLADYCESEDGYCYASGFCAGVWVWTPWADDGIQRRVLYVPATAGNNNSWAIVKYANNNISFVVRDGAGVIRQYYYSISNTSWTAGGWKYVEVCSNNSDNVLMAHHYNVYNDTWYDWTNTDGAGTGIQNGQSIDLHIGHAANADHLDGSVSEIHISPYDAIFPMKSFNNGNPPVNASPY